MIFGHSKLLRREIELIFKKVLLAFLLSFCLTLPAVSKDILRLTVTGESSGRIDIFLNSDLAPEHVKRIKLLTSEKKYDGIVFHRVIPGFMAQTGDIKFGNINNFDPGLVGMGGSDYPMLNEEFSDGTFLRGTVGMARARDPNSANSQFFIMFEAAPHLDGEYTIVGNVIAGMDVALGIKKGTATDNGAVDSPDYIISAKIISGVE